MLNILSEHRPNRRFHLIADSAYGGRSVLCRLVKEAVNWKLAVTMGEKLRPLPGRRVDGAARAVRVGSGGKFAPPTQSAGFAGRGG
jgi:hypothetical protein